MKKKIQGNISFQREKISNLKLRKGLPKLGILFVGVVFVVGLAFFVLVFVRDYFNLSF